MNQHLVPPCPEAIAERISLPVEYITVPYEQIDRDVTKAKAEYIRAVLYHKPNTSRGQIAVVVGKAPHRTGKLINDVVVTMPETAIDAACLARYPADLRQIAIDVSRESGIGLGLILATNRTCAPARIARHEILKRARAAAPHLTSEQLGELANLDGSHIRHLIRKGKI